MEKKEYENLKKRVDAYERAQKKLSKISNLLEIIQEIYNGNFQNGYLVISARGDFRQEDLIFDSPEDEFEFVTSTLAKLHYETIRKIQDC